MILPMNTTTRRAPRNAIQLAYATALENFRAASATAEGMKKERGVNYERCETDEEIDAMAEIEGECDRKAGIISAERALWAAEDALVAWGLDKLLRISTTAERTELLFLCDKVKTNVAARRKVAALCYTLAP